MMVDLVMEGVQDILKKNYDMFDNNFVLTLKRHINNRLNWVCIAHLVLKDLFIILKFLVECIYLSTNEIIPINLQ